MIDPNEVIDLAIELANTAIDAWREEPPSKAPGKIGGESLRGAFDYLHTALFGMAAGREALDGLCSEIDGYTSWLTPHRLCVAATRLPLEGLPIAYFASGNEETANEDIQPHGLCLAGPGNRDARRGSTERGGRT